MGEALARARGSWTRGRTRPAIRSP